VHDLYNRVEKRDEGKGAEKERLNMGVECAKGIEIKWKDA